MIVEIPRNKKGEPDFKELLPRIEAGDPIGILDIFTKDEVIAMVNLQIKKKDCVCNICGNEYSS